MLDETAKEIRDIADSIRKLQSTVTGGFARIEGVVQDVRYRQSLMRAQLTGMNNESANALEPRYDDRQVPPTTEDAHRIWDVFANHERRIVRLESELDLSPFE